MSVLVVVLAGVTTADEEIVLLENGDDDDEAADDDAVAAPTRDRSFMVVIEYFGRRGGWTGKDTSTNVGPKRRRPLN